MRRGRERVGRPFQYAGCYTLHLYCDAANKLHSEEFETRLGEFVGDTFTECAKRATELGWVIHRKNRTATCPACSGMGSQNKRTQPHYFGLGGISK